MKTFLQKVKKSTTSMGKAPYDDKKTIANISEATRKTVDYCEELRKTARVRVSR
jgi:hypothetical protein